jgi:hypothetical protein
MAMHLYWRERIALSGLFKWWHERREAKEAARRRKAVLDDTLEALIDLTGLKVRAVGGYAKKLRPAMAIAVDYIDGLVEAIPGPLEISPRAWDRNPVVNALFVTKEELSPLFRQRGEAKAYFAKTGAGEAYALMTMDRQDKTVLTTGEQGAIVKRDIPRTSVTYKNHHLLALSGSEEETRALIKMRALTVLAQVVQEKVGKAKAKEEELEYLENLYKVKLNSLGDWVDDELIHDDILHEKKPNITQMERSLEQVRRDLRLAREAFRSNDAHLQALKRVMENASETLKARAATTLLNQFSMIAQPGSYEKSHQVTLAHITLGDERSREAVLVRFKQDDFQ